MRPRKLEHQPYDASLRYAPWHARRISLILTALFFFNLGCEPKGGLEKEEKANTDKEVKTEASAPFDYRKDEPEVLLTYVGQKGRFLIAETISEIPDAARTTVRVVKDEMATGTAEVVFVGDLSGPGPLYNLRAMPRKAWQALGQEARTEELKTVSPEQAEPQATENVDVVLYGASWCGACKAAEAHLKKRGVRLIKKDIEEEPGARAEMKRKMKTAGLSGSSIPVIDIGGIVLLGASPQAIDTAIRRAQAL